MSKTQFTFLYYIKYYNNSNIDKFLEIFNIDNLPDHLYSSKNIIKLLDIKTRRDFYIFQNVYMDYFKEKLK